MHWATALMRRPTRPTDWLKVVIAAIFIFITTWLVARCAEESSRTTIILTVVWCGGLLIFAATLAINVFRGERNSTAEPFAWQWFNPFAITSFAGAELCFALNRHWGLMALSLQHQRRQMLTTTH